MHYMAPEILDKKQYGCKADVWSLGVLYFNLLFGAVPFNSIKNITKVSICCWILNRNVPKGSIWIARGNTQINLFLILIEKHLSTCLRRFSRSILKKDYPWLKLSSYYRKISDWGRATGLQSSLRAVLMMKLHPFISRKSNLFKEFSKKLENWSTSNR